MHFLVMFLSLINLMINKYTNIYSYSVATLRPASIHLKGKMTLIAKKFEDRCPPLGLHGLF